MTTTPPARRTDAPRGRLRRELGVMEAAALSVSIGTATTLAFLLAFATIILVSYAFIQFAKTGCSSRRS